MTTEVSCECCSKGVSTVGLDLLRDMAKCHYCRYYCLYDGHCREEYNELSMLEEDPYDQ